MDTPRPSPRTNRTRPVLIGARAAGGGIGEGAARAHDQGAARLHHGAPARPTPLPYHDTRPLSALPARSSRAASRPLVLIGHAASLTPYELDTPRPSPRTRRVPPAGLLARRRRLVVCRARAAAAARGARDAADRRAQVHPPPSLLLPLHVSLLCTHSLLSAHRYTQIRPGDRRNFPQPVPPRSLRTPGARPSARAGRRVGAPASARPCGAVCPPPATTAARRRRR